MIRTLIVASSPVVRAGLEALLAGHPSVSVVGSVSAVGALAEEVEAREPEVVVAVVEAGDPLARPGVRFRLSPDAAARAPALVLLADAPSPAWAADALRAGARAVLARHAGPDELIAAIDAAAAGLVTLPADLAAELLAPAGRTAAFAQAPNAVRSGVSPSTASPTPLTPREIEVLGALAEGLANKHIAARLGISDHTVKTHVASILAKLDAYSRAEAVAIGVRRGLILL